MGALTAESRADDEGLRVEVRILGEIYAVRSHHTDAERVRRTATRLDVRLRDLRKRFPGLGQARLNMLAALNLADELIRLQEQQKELIASLQGRIRELERQVGGQ